MHAMQRTGPAEVDPFDLARCDATHDTISALLARCDVLRGELEALRTEHAGLLRAAEDAGNAFRVERQRRQQVAQLTLGQLSALDTSAPAALTATPPAAPSRRHGRAA